MSDLQLSLLGIGALVIAGVLFYNHLQQRRLRKRLSEAFGEPRQDVLLGEGAPGGAASATSRIEPQLDDERSEPAAMPVKAQIGIPDTPAVQSIIDEMIDCTATLSSEVPLTAAQVAEVLSGVAACGRSWRAAGFNAERGVWEEVNRTVTGQYTRLKLALQLANRGGPVSAVQLSAFADAMNTLATRFSALVQLPDADQVLADAQALDIFCADVDVAIGANVVTAEEEGFSGTRIRALVESEGFRLEPDGIFHLEDANEHTLLTISNQASDPFLPEAVSGMSTTGITILLDVPRVADADHALQRMFELGHSLSVTLKGRLVDDNRATLTTASMDKIRQQLKDIHAVMNARGVLPGSPRALRLFS